MVEPSDQRLVLSSLIAHVHVTARKSFTLTQSVMKPCMQRVKFMEEPLAAT